MPIIKKLLCIAIIVYTQLGAQAATRYSRANGNWTNTSVWSATAGGASCNCTPSSSDNIIINHSITLDKELAYTSNGLSGTLTINIGGSLNGGSTYSLDVKAGGTLNLYGSMTILNATFYNGSTINMATGSVFIVNGNFDNRNNSVNVTINGAITVVGSFSTGNGSLISGSGTINVVNGPTNNNGTVFTISSSTPCGTYPCNLASNPLPVQWISYRLERQGTNVLVTWATATELNNSHFTILRANPLGDFVLLGTVQGAGSSTLTNNYNFVDSNPINGTAYYKVRQTDFDGKWVDSNIMTIKMVRNNHVVLSPNPANTNRIRITGIAYENAQSSVHVYRMDGSEIKVIITPSIADDEIYMELPEQAVRAGAAYLVQFTSRDSVIREKLIIN